MDVLPEEATVRSPALRGVPRWSCWSPPQGPHEDLCGGHAALSHRDDYCQFLREMIIQPGISKAKSGCSREDVTMEDHVSPAVLPLEDVAGLALKTAGGCPLVRVGGLRTFRPEQL